MNKIIRNTIILTVITVISGFLLGLVYQILHNGFQLAQCFA